MKNSRFKIWASLAGTFFGAALTAQADNLDFFTEILFEAKTGITTGVSQNVPVNIGDGGKISKTEFSVEAGAFYVNPSETYIAILELGFEREDYHFSGVSAPFSDVDRVKFFTWQEFVYDNSNGRAAAGMLSFGSNTAENASFADGSVLTLGLGVKQYLSREEFVWLGAVAAYSRLRERMYYLPVFILNLNLDEKLTLNISNGAELIWIPDDEKRWEISCGVRYELGEFQVGKHEGWQTDRVPIDFKVKHYFTKRFYVAGTASLLAWQRYRRWEHGDKQHSTEFTADPTVEFAIEAGLKF